MGNQASLSARSATFHASLPRQRSGRSTMSLRRVSFRSTRIREPIEEEEPAETLPPDVETAFTLEPIELKMQRNLCSCVHPVGRVDVVCAADNHFDHSLYIDRRIALGAHRDDVRLVRHELVVHAYLAQQHSVEQHPHLVLLHGQFESQRTLHILTEYYPLGSLMMVLNFHANAQSTSGRGLHFFETQDGVREAVRQVCSAVAFMHEQGIAHMDLALENIFVDTTGRLHVGDFRHAIFVGKERRRNFAPPAPIRRAYAAPELYSGREVDLLKADAWSLGIVLYMLLLKHAPLDEATTSDPQYRLLQVLGVPRFLEKALDDSASAVDTTADAPLVHDFVELLTGLLAINPNARWSLEFAVLKFPWLRLDPPPKATPSPAAAMIPILESTTEAAAMATSPTDTVTASGSNTDCAIPIDGASARSSTRTESGSVSSIADGGSDAPSALTVQISASASPALTESVASAVDAMR